MTLDQVLTKITSTIVNPLVTLMFGIALVVFIVGAIQYIRSGDDPKSRADGVRNFTYGIIGMAIMISAFGIAKFVQNALPATSGDYTSGYKAPDIGSLQSNGK